MNEIELLAQQIAAYKAESDRNIAELKAMLQPAPAQPEQPQRSLTERAILTKQAEELGVRVDQVEALLKKKEEIVRSTPDNPFGALIPSLQNTLIPADVKPMTEADREAHLDAIDPNRHQRHWEIYERGKQAPKPQNKIVEPGDTLSKMFKGSGLT